jgi:hypothetical protein
VRCSSVIAVIVAAPLAPPAAAQFVPLDATEPATFYVARDFRGQAHPDAEFARWALDAWSKASDGALKFVETDTERDAAIRVYWAWPGSEKYGEMRAIEIDGKPGALVFVNTATEGLGEEVHRRAERDQLFRDSIVFLTCVHELGHAVGLSHTDQFADIMYSFQYGGDIEKYFLRCRKRLKDRGDLRTRSPFSDNDLARLRALYQ